ncbi:MAG TPA: M20/M25/M40 family metallo-hydrolase [Thermoanaerobaculia bacterium]|nr:M20/M25/M40 family metallo-hydrolase [Thermoanaerobaculia bacterium]
MILKKLEPRRRKAARIALYGSLVLVAGYTWGVVKFLDAPLRNRQTEEWRRRDYANLPEVKLLQKYCQIDTSETTGDEVKGAEFLARQFQAAGIPYRIEKVGPRKANLYAWLVGKDSRPLVLHNHIDVSDVDPKEWFSPPFEARIKMPWIYGRGVFDMKSVAIAQMLAMIDLKKSGVPLEHSVLFLGTSSEERGSRLGVRRIIQLHPEMVRNFWTVLTEGGVVEARTREEIKFWGTEFAQKHYADLIVCGSDRQQLEDVSKTMKEIGPTVTDLRITPETRAVFEAYGPTRDRKDLRRIVNNPEEAMGDIASFRKLPNYLQSMMRDEAVPFPVREAPGGGYELEIKFQLLPGEELAAVREKLVPSWLTYGLTTMIDDPPSAHHGSPLDSRAFQTIEATLHEAYPDAPIGPYFLAWTATDARFFRTLGVPTYGFSPFLLMNTDTLAVDRANERFAVPAFAAGVDVYKKLVRRLASDT